MWDSYSGVATWDTYPDVKLTKGQRRDLERLWFVYGNGGPKSTDANHKFIQRILDAGKDTREHYGPDEECRQAVDEILDRLTIRETGRFYSNHPRKERGGFRGEVIESVFIEPNRQTDLGELSRLARKCITNADYAAGYTEKNGFYLSRGCHSADLFDTERKALAWGGIQVAAMAQEVLGVD